MTLLVRRRQRGVLADATLGAGATMLLLQSTAASGRGIAFTVAGVVLIALGLAALWGVPRPSFQVRTSSSLAGLLLGFAAVAPLGPGTWLAAAAGLVLLGATMHRVRRT